MNPIRLLTEAIKTWATSAGVTTALVLGLALLGSGCGVVFPRYESKVERVAQNDFEHGLIAAAEAACPQESEIASSCSVETDPSEGCDWSCGESIFKIPYAVTGEAVAYFEALIDEYKRRRFTLANNPDSASLEYLAEVTFHDRFSTPENAYEDVFVVTLRLNFSAICGPVCGEHIGAERQVIFDSLGNLLDIEGDRRRLIRPN